VNRFPEVAAGAVLFDGDEFGSAAQPGSDEELDFIVNYDVKYRVGADGDADDE
jgi:hypothetical protein